MNRNIEALRVNLYNGLSNWNDETDNGFDERLLTEEQIGKLYNKLAEVTESMLFEMGVHW